MPPCGPARSCGGRAPLGRTPRQDAPVLAGRQLPDGWTDLTARQPPSRRTPSAGAQMVVQHAKWLAESTRLTWQTPVASLNILLSSTCWRNDHNDFSHQGPGLIDVVLSKRGAVARIYLPPDANCLLSVADHCLRSRDCVNLIVIDKQPRLQKRSDAHRAWALERRLLPPTAARRSSGRRRTPARTSRIRRRSATGCGALERPTRPVPGQTGRACKRRCRDVGHPGRDGPGVTPGANDVRRSSGGRSGAWRRRR